MPGAIKPSSRASSADLAIAVILSYNFRLHMANLAERSQKGQCFQSQQNAVPAASARPSHRNIV
jgi:hypothetical protein